MKYSLQKRISAFVLAFALVMTTAFNSIGATTKADAAAKVKTLYLTKKTTSLVEGETGTAQWAVKATKATKALAAVKVTTSDSSVVKITKTTQSKKAGKTAKAAKKNKGTVKFTAVSAGTATIKIVTKKKTKKTKSFKVTVTAKATEAPATTQASADATTAPSATTSAAATTEVTSADASGSALKAVSLSTKAPKVGDTITAILSPVGATDVSKYTWYEDATEVSGNATNTYVVSSNAIGKTIKVVVTTKDGTKISSDTTAAVIVDNSTKVEIVDKNGFQSNGTALYGDTLDLTFGDGNGIPEQITWYINNKLVATYNSKNGALDAISITTGAGRIDATGQCYALVKNEAGETFKSNVVEIVKAETAATMTDVAFLEDYSNALNVPLTKTSSKYVASVTLNKDYAGTFYLVDSSKAEITNDTVVALDKLVTGNIYNATTNPSGKVVVKNDSSSMSAKTLLEDNTFDAYKYTNEGTGKVSYIFKVNKTGLTRGTKYNLIFDQSNIDGDNLGSNHNKNLNITTTPVVASYVKAPTKLVVTDVQTSADLPGWTAQLFTGDDKSTYISSDFTAATALAGAGHVNPLNNTSVKMLLYSKGDSTTSGGTNFVDSGAQLTTIINGKGDTNNIVTYPVATSVDQNPAGAANDGVGTNNFVYAEFSAPEGVFGKDTLTLVSAATKCAESVVTSVALEYEPSTTKGKDLVVKFTNLNADADVYLVKGSYTGAAPADETAAVDATKAFEVNNAAKYVAVTSANAGANSVTFSGKIDSVTDGKDGDAYAVVVVAKDGKHATYKSALQVAPVFKDVTRVLTTYVLAETNLDTNKQITVKDQFGKSMELSGNIVFAAKTGADQNSSSSSKLAVTILKGTGQTQRTITVTASVADIAAGDSFTYEFKNGQKLTMTALADIDVSDATDPTDVTKWKAVIK